MYTHRIKYRDYTVVICTRSMVNNNIVLHQLSSDRQEHINRWMISIIAPQPSGVKIFTALLPINDNSRLSLYLFLFFATSLLLTSTTYYMENCKGTSSGHLCKSSSWNSWIFCNISKGALSPFCPGVQTSQENLILKFSSESVWEYSKVLTNLCFVQQIYMG